MSSLYEETRQLYEDVCNFYELGRILAWGLTSVHYEYDKPTAFNNKTVTIPYSVITKLHKKMYEMNESS